MQDRALSEIVGLPVHTEIPYDALMPRRVSNLLVVSSLYDSYTIIEDGKLSEMLFSEYLDLDLRFTPSIERVSTAEDALDRLRTESFDLVISMARVGEMNVVAFAEAVHAIDPTVPVILLASSARELGLLPRVRHPKGIDSVFVWLGDVRLFVAIIKCVEDQMNALHDAETAGVKSIVLVEDSVQFYSSYLPLLYTEIWNQTRLLTTESVNRTQRTLRMRARPKVLLAKTYEDGIRLCEQHQSSLLGVIVDAAFPHGGAMDPEAGCHLAQWLRERVPNLPILMQSDSKNAEHARALGLQFVDKNSPTLLADLRQFMQQHLGFGEFVFRDAAGATIARASDLRTLEWAIQAVPEEQLHPNITRNDFYMWLTARMEFRLADALRLAVDECEGQPKELGSRLLQTLRVFRRSAFAGVVAEYSKHTFEGGYGFVRIGDGSLGGKGRGLAFVHSLIDRYQLEHRFKSVRIGVPPTAVLATRVFDRFMESSGLLHYALTETDDQKITEAFLAAEFPGEILEDLWNLLQWVHYPLAVRSSSLLEDASYQPFAGIYKTFMIPNDSEDPEIRLEQLCDAVKMVYASTYHTDPKAYMESLPNRLEDEKMAVIIQQVVGRRRESYIYPNFAGVGRSINFYPAEGTRPEDGIVSVALGMGKAVVDGGRCVRFCPSYPTKPIQSFSTDDYLENSPQSFLAMDLSGSGHPTGRRLDANRLELVSLDLDVADRHGTLSMVGSVYSPDNDAIYDGTSRAGIRLVTMAGVLKGRVFPLAEITSFLLQVGTAASSGPVEIEFAVNLSDSPDKPHEFAFLQIRPLVLGSEFQEVEIEQNDNTNAVCISHKALGNGYISEVADIVYVREDNFDRSITSRVADEVGQFNHELRRQGRPYLLIGPGRWGSSDPWLGIPVKWAQISGVKCIVETGFEDMVVDPSQGSHFFQNIMSFGIGYLTVDLRTNRGDVLNRSWLDAQPARKESKYLRHVSLDRPLRIALNGRKNYGLVKFESA